LSGTLGPALASVAFRITGRPPRERSQTIRLAVVFLRSSAFRVCV